MYVVIASGGKQYRVCEGATLKLEKLAGEIGETVDIEHVLMAVDGDNIQVGSPWVEGGKVSATILRQDRDKKLKIVKFRRRKNSRRQMGHRQSFTEVRIDAIHVGGMRAKTAKAKKASEHEPSVKHADAAKIQAAAAPKARKKSADETEE